MDKNNRENPSRQRRRQTLNHVFERFSDLVEFHPKVKELGKKSRMIADIPYVQDGLKKHLLDIYIPTETHGPHPVLIYLHGGGFMTCSKETHRACGRIFSSQGFLVFAFNYRLAPEHPFPAAFEDACLAYEWAINNAEQYGGDAGRLCMAGESAGANLALALVAATCIKRSEPLAQSLWALNTTPAAVLLHCGLLQVSNPERLKATRQARAFVIGDYSMRIVRGIERDYLGASPHGHDSLRAFADPLNIIEQAEKTNRPLPPIYAAVGTSDIVCNDTRRLEKALINLHAEHQARYFKNEGHVLHFQFWRKNSYTMWKESVDFLIQHAGA